MALSIKPQSKLSSTSKELWGHMIKSLKLFEEISEGFATKTLMLEMQSRFSSAQNFKGVCFDDSEENYIVSSGRIMYYFRQK